MDGETQAIDEFTPGKEMQPGRARFMTMPFKRNGMTGDGLWIPSGDTLMDLDRYQALKMAPKAIVRPRPSQKGKPT